MKKAKLKVDVKLSNAINKIQTGVIDIFGKRIFVGINMFVVHIKDEGHSELAFQYTYQNGSTKVEPIFCVRDYNVTPKEFVNQFNKLIKEADKKYEKDKEERIKNLGYKLVPTVYSHTGFAYKKVNKKINKKQ
jgi:hypothetical protein